MRWFWKSNTGYALVVSVIKSINIHIWFIVGVGYTTPTTIRSHNFITSVPDRLLIDSVAKPE